jgi:hypothetical protein
MWNKLRDVVRFVSFDSVSGEAFLGNVPLKNYISLFAPAAPATAVANQYVTSTAMVNAGYSIANSGLPGDGLCRNVTCTRTVVTGADTPGILTVTGTDYNDKVITEVLIPGAHTVLVSGKLAFKSVTAVVGSGWVVDSGVAYDTIVVGFGDVVGFSSILSKGDILLFVWNQAILTAATTPALPTFTYSKEVSGCTIPLPAAANAAKKLIAILLQFKG